MQPNTLTRRDKSKIYVKNIRKILVGSQPTEKFDPEADPKKIIPDPQHCFFH